MNRMSPTVNGRWWRLTPANCFPILDIITRWNKIMHLLHSRPCPAAVNYWRNASTAAASRTARQSSLNVRSTSQHAYRLKEALHPHEWVYEQFWHWSNRLLLILDTSARFHRNWTDTQLELILVMLRRIRLRLRVLWKRPEGVTQPECVALPKHHSRKRGDTVSDEEVWARQQCQLGVRIRLRPEVGWLPCDQLKLSHKNGVRRLAARSHIWHRYTTFIIFFGLRTISCFMQR